MANTPSALRRSSSQQDPNLCPICRTRPEGYCLQAELNEAALCSLILDLHDGLVQNLFAAFSQIHSLRQFVAHAGADGQALEQGLRRIGELIESSLQEIRGFVGAFGPEEFEKQDLRAMVEGLAMQREDLTGMRIAVEVAEELPHVPLPVKIALFRILQEAFSNAYRHARAERLQVRLLRDGDSVHLEILDDGQGFDPQTVLETASGSGGHLGLRGMRDRVHMLGGTFHLESAPGQGTAIRVWIPCYEETTADR